jgi:hypothetical protein
MGTIKQCILGGFSGKVGTVIGASWKGINYMRSIPQHVKNPRTAGQVSRRSKKAAHSGSFYFKIMFIVICRENRTFVPRVIDTQFLFVFSSAFNVPHLYH